MKPLRAATVQIEAEDDEAVAGDREQHQATLSLERKSSPAGDAGGTAGKPVPGSAKIPVPVGYHAPNQAVRKIEEQDNEVKRKEIWHATSLS